MAKKNGNGGLETVNEDKELEIGSAIPGDDEEASASTSRGERAQFIVNGQYIKDLSFENPNILRMMQQSGAEQPEVNIDLGVNVKGVSEGGYEVTLQIRVETKRENITGFIIELTYAGLITLVGWPKEQVEPILFIEGPKLLFPFARHIISTVTQNGGFPPLNLNPIDFTELYQRRLAQAREKAAGAGLVN
jgi:preprotein translocase subunit SecB